MGAAQLASAWSALDAANAQAPKLILEAEIGIARRGVHRGSPPPGNK